MTPRPPERSVSGTKPRRLWCLLAAWMAFGAPLRAGDDLIDPWATPARSPAADRESSPESRSDAQGAFVVTLVNGDRLTGTFTNLDEKRLRVRPDMAAAAEIDVPLTSVDTVDRTVAPRPFEPRGDRLYPVAGGVIHGGLSGIDAKGITIDAHLVGPLTLPLEAVAAFVRDGGDQPERTAPARFHEVHDVTGSRLVGDAEFSPAGATVVAEGLSATVAIRQVAAILFPEAAVDSGDGEAVPTPLRCTLELLNGSEIVGISPRLDRDRLAVEVARGRSVAVPLDNVARLSFETQRDAGRRVVFWSQFADLGEEAAHMAEALREGLPRGWKLEADGAGPPAGQLAAALRTAGVLVVPEMEKYDGGDIDAAALGRDLQAFLGRGGTVVIAGVDEDTAGFWEEAGVFSLSSMDRVEAEDCRFVRGHTLGRDVGDSFATVNATYGFETEDPGLEPVARTPEGAAVVLIKKVGRGAVVLLGMDYYSRSPAIDQVLVNAVTRPRGR